MSQLSYGEAMVLSARMASVWPEVTGHFDIATNACILSTRVAIQAFRHFGVDCKPLSVSAQAWNRAWQAQIDAGKDFTTAEPGSGAHAVFINRDLKGIVARTGRQGWDGHLLALLPHYGIALDLSAGQFSRSQFNMKFSPSVVLLPKGFDPRTKCDVHFGFENSDGSRVLYRHEPKQRGWDQAPDWRRSSKDLAGAMIRESKSFRDASPRELLALRSASLVMENGQQYELDVKPQGPSLDM